MPARDQWASWKDHPCTQAMIELLKQEREYGIEEVAVGSDSSDLLRYGIKVGKLNALTAIINFGFIQEEEDNDSGKD